MSTIGRYIRTLPHLKPWQIAGRILAPARRRVVRWTIPDAPPDRTGGFKARTEFIHHDPWNERGRIVRGGFRFLNKDGDLGLPIRWDAPGEPLLWRFNLHYFHWLYLLMPGEQQDFCRDWIRANPVGTGVGWHPYPTSLRIVNWCKAQPADHDVLDSLYLQAAWLSRNLETYVYGNHLLENARALVMAGQFFGEQGEAADWLEKGLEILRSEIPEQILGDGCHFERSPMYQALMLEALLDVLNVLPEHHPIHARLADTAARMTIALQVMTHPDGGIALLNDSTLEIAPSTEALVDYAERLIGTSFEARPSLPDAGYHVVDRPDIYLIVDAGPPGPDYLLAHAHADIFSYELSLAGERFVVDPGVFEYAAGEMRDYVRSTRSHSTVTVDGVDQVECWGSFRVGRRSAPQDVNIQSDIDSWTVSGAFPGFSDVLGDGITHEREITVEMNLGLIRVRDRITGRGRHTVSSRIHLHPDVEIEGDSTITLRRDSITCSLEAQGRSFAREDGWYCPEFGRRIQSTVLLLEEVVELPVELTYHFRFEPRPASE